MKLHVKLGVVICSISLFGLLSITKHNSAEADTSIAAPKVAAAKTKQKAKSKGQNRVRCNVFANNKTKTYQLVEDRVCFRKEKHAIKAGFQKEGEYEEVR